MLSDPVVGARLSPLYDIVCTAVYDVTPRMAMFIGGTDDPAAITEDSCGGLRRTAESMSRCSFVTFERLPIVLASALPRFAAAATAEGWHRLVIDEVVRVIDERATLLGA